MSTPICQHAWFILDVVGVCHVSKLPRPELVRLFELVPDLTRSWRILTHPDRRRAPAVSAFFDFIADETATLRPILTG